MREGSRAAAHNGELGLQPQTLGAEAAPGGRMLPSQSPGACSLSCVESGFLRERARRCCSLTAKDGERVGIGVGEALPPRLPEEARGPRGERQAGTLRPACRGPLAAGVFSSGLRAHKVTAAPSPPTRVRPPPLIAGQPVSRLRPNPPRSPWDSGVP